MNDIDIEVRKMRGPIGRVLSRWTALLHRYDLWRLDRAKREATELVGY